MDYFGAYKDIWNFHKKFIDRISDNDTYWETVVNEAKELSQKYQEHPFIRGLALVEIEELERIYKEKMQNAADGTVQEIHA